MTGPEAIPIPTTDPQKAKARPRASPWNAWESVASAELSCMAAPAPWSARAAIRTPPLVTNQTAIAALETRTGQSPKSACR